MAKKRIAVTTRVYWEPWSPPTTPPASIVADITDGIIKPEAGDAELVRLGFEPTEHRPDPAAFDPLSEGIWTITMVIVWIRWRSADAVREMWPVYRKEFKFWVTKIYPSRPLTGVGPTGPRPHRDLEDKGAPCPELELRDFPAPAFDEVEAFEQLRSRAEAGKIAGTGILAAIGSNQQPGDGLQRQIPAEHWATAELRTGHKPHGYAIVFGWSAKAAFCYENVRFSSAAVRELWPDTGGVLPVVGSPAPKRHRGAKPRYPWEACKKKLLEKLEHDGPPTSEGGDPKWVSQADAERWVHEWMQKRLGPDVDTPAESRIRFYTAKWLSQFKLSQRQGS